jgi:predicted DNA-binding transcriptional regulator YafY
MMIGKVIRIFNIFNAIQANPGISAADLALNCDVNIRTIYRDIDIITLIAPGCFKFINYITYYARGLNKCALKT